MFKTYTQNRQHVLRDGAVHAMIIVEAPLPHESELIPFDHEIASPG